MSVSVTMRPSSADAGQTIQGSAGSYSPNASGEYVVTDPRDVAALLFRGWTPANTPAGADSYVVDITGVVPSATSGTYGTAKTLSSDSGAASLIPLSMDLIFGGTFAGGGETITVQLVVTYNDGTTTTVTSFTATATGTTALTNAQLRGLFSDGKSIASIAINCKSSVNTSTATLEVKSHGENRAA